MGKNKMKPSGPLVLEDVISAFETTGDSLRYYLDLKTMQIEEVDEVYGDSSLREKIEENWDQYLPLPTKFEVQDYQIMESFISSREDAMVKNSLLAAIRVRRGAFKRFRECVSSYGIRQEWLDFENLEYRKRAIRWCRENDLSYTENGKHPIEMEVLMLYFTICKVSSYRNVDLSSDYVFIMKTDKENSLICPTMLVPPGVKERSDGWIGFRVKGTMDFSLIGILAKISAVLAEAKVGICAVSTYDTDYIFVRAEDYQTAGQALVDAGYFTPPQ